MLTRICHGAGWAAPDGINDRAGFRTLHVRFCSADRRRSSHYKFNINPATLRADWEVWICGSAGTCFLMPVSLVRRIYDDPGAYADRRHPKIRVVPVDAERHRVTFAKGGGALDIGPYFLAVL